MGQLANAPLVYVLGVLRFPRSADVDACAADLHRTLIADYPRATPIDAPQYNIVVKDGGIHVSNEVVRIWQFSSADHRWAVILNAGMIGLHTVAYEHHRDFIRRFVAVAEAARSIGGLSVNWIEGLALRYVDLVAARPTETLESYFVPHVLPSLPRGMAGLDLEEGVHLARYRTSSGSLRLQVLRSPPFAIPPELNTPVFQANAWSIERPAGDFGILDVDHGVAFDPPVTFDSTFLRTKMLELREPVSRAFSAVTTDFAKNVWSGEKA